MTPSRLLLIVLTLWGLLMIVPDLLRVTQSLGSLGFFANNDGLIYDANGPFPEDALSPPGAPGSGSATGSTSTRCAARSARSEECGSTLAVLGGVEFRAARPGGHDRSRCRRGAPARQVTLIAEQRPYNVLIRAVNLLCQIAGILVMSRRRGSCGRDHRR